MYHVLYVDDEPELLVIAKLYLEDSQEFTVDTATSAQEMLKGQSLLVYDAIISDYQMPDMDGITFLKEVRARFGTIPFLLFTGRGREEVVIEAINNGADIYLQKGGDARSLFAELMQKIRIVVQRHQAENALRENRRTLVTLMDNLLGMAYRCRNDPDWTMEFVSEGCRALTGYDSDDLLDNRTVSFGELVHPEDQQMIWTQIQTCIDRCQPFQIEYRIRDRSGRIIWVWEQGRGVFNDQGDLLAIEGYISDITQRRETEEELQRINERNRALMLANPDLMFVYSVDGRIVDFHGGDISALYVPPDQFLGRSVNEVLPPEVARIICDNIACIAENGVLRRYEYSLDIGGRTRYFESRLVRSGDEEFLSIVREIPKQGDAKEAVQEGEERYLPDA